MTQSEPPEGGSFHSPQVMSRVSGQHYFVYVLWSHSGSRFYIGLSEDPYHRLTQHNSGDVAGWTGRFRPWVIVHVEEYESYTEARRRELDLKAQKGGRGFFAKTGLNQSSFKPGS